MRVYFIGAHSTGKTTLARYVQGKHKLPLLTEIARTVLAERELSLDSLRTDLEAVNDYQQTVLYRQFAEEKKHASFVSDRAFDALAYAGQHSQILTYVIASRECKEYIDSLHSPDVRIFFVRPSRATLKQDGVRESLTWDGIVQIDAMCKFMLEMWKLPYFGISTDSMQERVRLVDSVISLSPPPAEP